MSTLGSNHAIEKFGKDSKALPDNRLAVIRFKAPKGSKEKAIENKCASVPVLVLAGFSSEERVKLNPFIDEMIQEAQDSILRQMVIAGKTTVASEQINASAVLKYLTAESLSKRLTSDMVKAWYKDVLEDSLALKLMEKFGVTDKPSDAEEKKINTLLTVYRDKFASLSSGATFMPSEACDKLLVVLKLAPEGDPMASKFITRLEEMKAKSDDDFEGLDIGQ